VTEWTYNVEILRPGDTYNASRGKAAVQALLIAKAMQGWEFIESHPALDGVGRYYVFRQVVPDTV
jgi:hypothetical protein